MADNQAYEQADFDPSIDKESSKAWLNLIEDAEKALKDWQDKSDNIDKRFADLARLANVTRDREFQLFWANIQVLGPSVYSRPPVPVVVPRFRDRRAVPRTASELLERCATVAFEKDGIDATMRLIRDDMIRLARGCAWVRYEDKEKNGKKIEKVCIEHVDRRDWLCSPARKWQEVDWVARRAWMSPDEMEKRFKGDAWKDAAFENIDRDRQDRGNRDPIKKAGVWEIWSKSEDCVVWVTPGVEEVLERGEPHLDLEGFFPCPRPAYSTVQPDSLVPVPDYVYYKDQIEEINELTARIADLSDAVRLKGFYQSGGEIGAAVETAMKQTDNKAILIPVSNWAAFGSNNGDPIIWLPLEMIANTITGLVELRRQLIDDVYQITGLSDIMRGQSDASETLGAQELKSQYGSVRVRDRQFELIRLALDLTRISCEIMGENFDQKTLVDMSQMELPTDADIKKQIRDLEEQGKQIVAQAAKTAREAMDDPQNQAKAQQDPEGAQKAAQQLQQQAQEQVQQIQQQIQKAGETVTIDQVMKLLKEQRLRPFALDIETDSTIAPDENAQKQRATEFVTAVGGFLNQAITAVQTVPQVAPLMADTLKYVASQFRAGRVLDQSIDEFADTMKQMAAAPKPNPEADAAQAQVQSDQARLQMEQQKHQEEQQARAQDTQLKQQAFERDSQIKAALADHEAQMRERETAERIQIMQSDGLQKAHLVIDEGHHLEDAAAAHLGATVSRRALQRLFNRLDRRGKGLLPALVARLTVGNDLLSTASLDLVNTRLAPAVHAARDKSGVLFELLDVVLRESGETVLRLTGEFATHPIWRAGLRRELDDTLGEIEMLANGLQLVRERLEGGGRSDDAVMPLLNEMRSVTRRLQLAGDGLRRALDPTGSEATVRWIEARGRERAVSVSTVPLDLAPILREDLFKRAATTVVTSATLAADGKFEFLVNRLGLNDPELEPLTGIYPSPFRYREQAILAIPGEVPAPNVNAAGHASAVARIAMDVAAAANGGMFVLFTSHRDVRAMAAELRARGIDRRWPLLVHGDESRDALLARFRDTGNAVLLGTASFWEGVDVPGDALRALLIAKLPFRVPTEPVTAANCEAIAAAGGDAFREYMLPHASLRLKQGFGRLIRSSADRGVVVIADSRVVTKGYGRGLLEGLPPARRVVGRWSDLLSTIQTFYHQ